GRGARGCATCCGGAMDLAAEAPAHYPQGFPAIDAVAEASREQRVASPRGGGCAAKTELDQIFGMSTNWYQCCAHTFHQSVACSHEQKDAFEISGELPCCHQRRCSSKRP